MFSVVRFYYKTFTRRDTSGTQHFLILWLKFFLYDPSASATFSSANSAQGGVWAWTFRHQELKSLSSTGRNAVRFLNSWKSFCGQKRSTCPSDLSLCDVQTSNWPHPSYQPPTLILRATTASGAFLPSFMSKIFLFNTRFYVLLSLPLKNT